MYNLTTLQIKRIAKKALNDFYGFSPDLKNIRLLESSGNGDYIMFSINGIEYFCYNFSSIEKRESYTY